MIDHETNSFCKKVSENNRLTSVVIKKFGVTERDPFTRILRREIVTGQREKPGTARQIQVDRLFLAAIRRAVFTA